MTQAPAVLLPALCYNLSPALEEQCSDSPNLSHLHKTSGKKSRIKKKREICMSFSKQNSLQNSTEESALHALVYCFAVKQKCTDAREFIEKQF